MQKFIFLTASAAFDRLRNKTANKAIGSTLNSTTLKIIYVARPLIVVYNHTNFKASLIMFVELLGFEVICFNFTWHSSFQTSLDHSNIDLPPTFLINESASPQTNLKHLLSCYITGKPSFS